MIGYLLTSPVMAEGGLNEEAAPYQSSFEGYKPLTDENIVDWKKLNQQAATSEKSMPGMSENMDMTNMPGMEKSNAKASSSDMSNMKDMDHSKMQGMQIDESPNRPKNSDMGNMPGMNMEKSNAKAGGSDMADMPGMNTAPKKSSSDMSSMKGMDHSKMQGMQMDKSTTKTNSSDVDNMPGMNMGKSNAKAGVSDMPDMPGMSTTPKKGSSNMSSMKVMDHSKMQGMQMGQSATNPNNSDMAKMPDMDMSKPDTSNSQDTTTASKPESSDMSNMADMDHSKMKTMNTESATNDQGFQIIPNFHPIVVHFPIALTVIAFLLNIASYVRRSHPISVQLAGAGHFTLWLAALSAAVAVLFGWLAFNSISNHDDAGHAAMLLHRAWAIPTAFGLILLASWDAWKYRVNELISVPMLFFLLLLSQAIAVTGWLGGEVVYRHGIGVLSMPSSGTGHAHGDANVNASSQSKNGELTDMNHDPEGESHAH
ncbi:MAG: hypothetical protein CTY27_01540 [Methylotenera sp.]|nr:MAG: hypothetical protein CTY27_01540 [Methylotenera sp.]